MRGLVQRVTQARVTLVETGEVTILRYLVMHDCGRIINPMVVRG